MRLNFLRSVYFVNISFFHLRISKSDQLKKILGQFNITGYQQLINIFCHFNSCRSCLIMYNVCRRPWIITALTNFNHQLKRKPIYNFHQCLLDNMILSCIKLDRHLCREIANLHRLKVRLRPQHLWIINSDWLLM